MRPHVSILLLALGFASAGAARGEEAEGSLRAAVDGFSRTTLADGGGWKAYAAWLHDDLTRWDVGARIVDKSALVESVRQWWESGARLATTEQNVLSLSVSDHVGIVRVRKSETYVDASGGKAGAFNGYVDQTWVQTDGAWKLLAMNIVPLPAGE